MAKTAMVKKLPSKIFLKSRHSISNFRIVGDPKHIKNHNLKYKCSSHKYKGNDAVCQRSFCGDESFRVAFAHNKLDAGEDYRDYRNCNPGSQHYIHHHAQKVTDGTIVGRPKLPGGSLQSSPQIIHSLAIRTYGVAS